MTSFLSRSGYAFVSLMLIAGLGAGCSSGPKPQSSSQPPASESPAAKPDESASEPQEGGDQSADVVEFTLKNNTDHPITEFYVSHRSVDDWQDDLIPEGTELKPGAEVKVTISNASTDCQYDIKAIFGPSEEGAPGGSHEDTSAEICDGSTYTYTGN